MALLDMFDKATKGTNPVQPGELAARISALEARFNRESTLAIKDKGDLERKVEEITNRVDYRQQATAELRLRVERMELAFAEATESAKHDTTDSQIEALRTTLENMQLRPQTDFQPAIDKLHASYDELVKATDAAAARHAEIVATTMTAKEEALKASIVRLDQAMNSLSSNFDHDHLRVQEFGDDLNASNARIDDLYKWNSKHCDAIAALENRPAAAPATATEDLSSAIVELRTAMEAQKNTLGGIGARNEALGASINEHVEKMKDVQADIAVLDNRTAEINAAIAELRAHPAPAQSPDYTAQIQEFARNFNMIERRIDNEIAARGEAVGTIKQQLGAPIDTLNKVILGYNARISAVEQRLPPPQ